MLLIPCSRNVAQHDHDCAVVYVLVCPQVHTVVLAAAELFSEHLGKSGYCGCLLRHVDNSVRCYAYLEPSFVCGSTVDVRGNSRSTPWLRLNAVEDSGNQEYHQSG